MPKLSRLSELHVAVTIDFHGETINAVVAPGRWNASLEDELMEAEVRKSAFLLVQRLLVSWDILGEDDRPLPLDDASLRTVPSAAIAAVANAITDAVRPGKEQPAG